jgi:ribonuclease HI
METERVTIYTDGSATPNPGRGGYAAYLTCGDAKKLVTDNSGDMLTTNNQAELMAMIIGLEALKRPCTVTIISDSQYAVNMGSGKWQPKTNGDLIEKIEELCRVHAVQFKWVREFTLPEQTIVHNAAERESQS